MNPEEMILEKNHLKEVLEKVKSAEKKLSNDLETLGKENIERLKDLRYEGASSYGYGMSDFDTLLEQLHQKNLAFGLKGKYQTIRELNFLISEPYFSRIDLSDPGSNEVNSFYIGKFSYTEDKPVITDWRSKVASVYYRYRYPQKGVKYDTLSGEEVKDLKLKRTYEIQDGSLIKYYNNDLQLDESTIISEKIGKRTGGVLEDIVQTIQISQLDIIEADPRQVCVVQGCVGSGKSTVAIHKLAHIFFNYPKLVHPGRSLMITKSQILAGYLSTLFPKLGIFDLTYKTVRDLVYSFNFIENLNLKFDLDKGVDTSSFGVNNVKKLQKKILSSHVYYEKAVGKVFKDPDLESYASFKYSKDETPYENVMYLLRDITEAIMSQKESLKLNPNGPNSWLNKENLLRLRKILKQTNKIKNELTNTTVKKILKEFDINISSELTYTELLVYIYVYSEIIGIRKFKQYEYCVVDEAQDFSLLEYLVLNSMVMRGRFALFGDLNQSLESDGIKNWEDVPNVIQSAKQAIKFKLDTNYRSTKQIIDFANKILSPYTKKYLPKSIDRIGPEPVCEIFDNKDLLLEKFKEEVKSNMGNIDKSIGVIVFDEGNKFFSDIRDIMSELNIGGKKNNFIELDPSRKISYTPKGVYLMKSEDCKGLEFSKVYVLGANPAKIKNFSFARKVFVAVTRAMNELLVYGVK